MKTSCSRVNHRRRERGSAVVVALAMLAIMLICVSVNSVAVRSLGRELKLLEKKQVQRIQPAAQKQSGQQRPNPQTHD